MKVSMFTKEEMHAAIRPNFVCLFWSRNAREPWRRSLTSQTDHWGEWRMRRVFTISRSTTKSGGHSNVRPWDAQSCRPKGRCFPFTRLSRKIAVEGSFILGDSNWKLFQVGYPVDTHTDDFFTRGYRSRIARLSLGWSLVDGRKGLFGWNLRPCQFYKEYIQTDQRTQKYILTPWHPAQRLKFKKGKNLFHKKPSPEKEREINKRGKWTHKSSARMNS